MVPDFYQPTMLHRFVARSIGGDSFTDPITRGGWAVWMLELGINLGLADPAWAHAMAYDFHVWKQLQMPSEVRVYPGTQYYANVIASRGSYWKSLFPDDGLPDWGDDA